MGSLLEKKIKSIGGQEMGKKSGKEIFAICRMGWAFAGQGQN